MIKIAINGFGRIGRLFMRQTEDKEGIKVVAVNDLGDGENLAYLLRHDTVYRAWNHSVVFNHETLLIDDARSVKFLSQKDPEQLPWQDLGVDIVIESTGVFDTYEAASRHLKAGAKHVVITAPPKDPDGELGKTVLIGVNEEFFGKCSITSNASCTTNSAAPVMAVLNEALGIEKAMLSTIHAYTATQSVVDSAVKGSDFRRGRAAAENISPSTTGAAIAVSRAIPSLKSKFDGIAFRVPVEAGSISDITFISKRNTTKEEVNEILKKASRLKRWASVLKVTEEDLVSSDIIGESYGAVVDLKFTKVVDGNLVKVLSWYDNEWGYVSTLVSHVEKVGKLL